MPGVISKWTGSRSSSPMPQEDMFRGRSEKSGGARSQQSQYSNGYGSDQQSEGDESPTYLLEHLATFSVGSMYGVVVPKDGLKRLLEMEKTAGIWTQKMQMRLDKKWMVIIDYENGDVVERFPMKLISDPTAYTSDDARELYNNILIFIVKEDSKNNSPAEMHIFQCAQISAQDLVDDIKMYMSGKSASRRRGGGGGYPHGARHLPPPPNKPPPDPPSATNGGGGGGINVREQVHAFNQVAAAGGPPHHHHHMYGPRASHSRELMNDETSSTGSDRYEAEVLVLNRCFDDIERFIFRLHSIAHAFKELEKKQEAQMKKKNKKGQQATGDKLLSFRAKPPPEKDFVDILQKFKLCFNLLAKLKAHIHDPNAAELVHFLFTPLALVVDAARDSHCAPNLPQHVTIPLLTRQAIQLLANCCTSKETDLWQSLGPYWTTPRNEWKDIVDNYKPIFMDGWAIPTGFSDECSLSPSPRGDTSELARSPTEVDYHPHPKDSHHHPGGSSDYFYEERRRTVSPSTLVDRYHPHHQDRPVSPEYLSRGGPGGGMERDNRSDFSADSIEHSSPADRFEAQQQHWLEELLSRRAKVVQVVYHRHANNDKELTVLKGEILEILDDSRNWWKARNMQGQVGHVPNTIVIPYDEMDYSHQPLYAPREPDTSGHDSSMAKDRYSDGGSGSPSHLGESRRPPLPPPAPADWVRRERQGKKDGRQPTSTNLPLRDNPPGLRSRSFPRSTARYLRECYYCNLRRANEGVRSSHPLHRGQPSFPSLRNSPIREELEKEEHEYSRASSCSPSLSYRSGRREDIPRHGNPISPIKADLGSRSPEMTPDLRSDSTSFKFNKPDSEPPKLHPKPSPQRKIQPDEKSLMDDERNNSQVEESFVPTPERNRNEIKENEIRNENRGERKGANGSKSDNEGSPSSPGTKETDPRGRSPSYDREAFEKELRESLGPTSGRKLTCPQHNTTSCSFLSEASTSEDVLHWLEIKGFSQKTRQEMEGIGGYVLFAFRKSELEELLGPKEGSRLYSYLSLQRDVNKDRRAEAKRDKKKNQPHSPVKKEDPATDGTPDHRQVKSGRKFAEEAEL